MKKELRQLIRQKRTTCTLAQRNSASRIIITKLLSLQQWSDAPVIGCYLPMEDEVQTRQLFNLAWVANKQIAVPVITPNNPNMHFQTIHSHKQLEAGPLGILQPRKSTPALQFTASDLFIIPGIAFDHQCNRMGRGKGFYDRYLAQCPAFRVGVAFDYQIVPRVPTSPNDIPMNMVLTENQTIFPTEDGSTHNQTLSPA